MASNTPQLQPSNGRHKDWGLYSSPDDLPNAIAFPYGAVPPRLEVGDTATVELTTSGSPNFTRTVYECVNSGTLLGGDAIWREIGGAISIVNIPTSGIIGFVWGSARVFTVTAGSGPVTLQPVPSTQINRIITIKKTSTSLNGITFQPDPGWGIEGGAPGVPLLLPNSNTPNQIAWTILADVAALQYRII